MNDRTQACLEALAAIETDPLELPPSVEAHVARCTTCSEARVAWLAMEDAPPALAPAGYFEHLPDRILMKLPARPRKGVLPPALWALAAGLLLAVGAGGFMVGRANRPPLAEATLAPAPQGLPGSQPETPFLENDDSMTQLHRMNPQEAKALLDRLDAKEQKP